MSGAKLAKVVDIKYYYEYGVRKRRRRRVIPGTLRLDVRLVQMQLAVCREPLECGSKGLQKLILRILYILCSVRSTQTITNCPPRDCALIHRRR